MQKYRPKPHKGTQNIHLFLLTKPSLVKNQRTVGFKPTTISSPRNLLITGEKVIKEVSGSYFSLVYQQQQT